MSKENTITDRRLLAALDYIDQKYIDDVFNIIKEPEASVEQKITWKTPFKHWKQLVALAACILLLSIASPLVSYIAEVIRDFNAGAGSGTTEEISSAIVTDENGVPYTYPMFVEDLEPLTAEEMFKVDSIWYKKEYDYIYNQAYDLYINNVNKKYSESEARSKAEEMATRGANALGKHIFFNEWYYADSRYYGKINDCIILVSVGMATVVTDYNIAGHTISFSNSAVIYVVKDDKLLELYEAYDLGYLTDDNIGLISERNDAYDVYLDSYLKEMQNKKEN
ncbi:MAG: hypothetical protein J6S71_09070 [Clostridia bacterium]|nr:hypothetical protein [Clostridia bacterium]